MPFDLRGTQLMNIPEKLDAWASASRKTWKAM